MNYRLKHQDVYWLTPNYQPVEGAPRTSHELHGFSDRDAHEFDVAVIPLSGTGDPILAPRRAFYQHQPESFAALDDRITDHGEGFPASFESDADDEPSGQSLSFSSVTEAVRAAWLNPPELARTTLLALLVGFFVYRYVTG